MTKYYYTYSITKNRVIRIGADTITQIFKSVDGMEKVHINLIKKFDKFSDAFTHALGMTEILGVEFIKTDAVICVDDGEIYKNSNQASVANELPRSNMLKHLRGKRGTIGGKSFRYYFELESEDDTQTESAQ